MRGPNKTMARFFLKYYVNIHATITQKIKYNDQFDHK